MAVISGATPGRGRSGDAGLAAVRAWTVKYQDEAAGGADLRRRTRRQPAAAEWMVVDRDQDIATDDDHPAVFGHRFDAPMAGHFTGMPVHYDLHAWAWMENPDGGFTADNPTVNCP